MTFNEESVDEIFATLGKMLSKAYRSPVKRVGRPSWAQQRTRGAARRAGKSLLKTLGTGIDQAGDYMSKNRARYFSVDTTPTGTPQEPTPPKPQVQPGEPPKPPTVQGTKPKKPATPKEPIQMAFKFPKARAKKVIADTPQNPEVKRRPVRPGGIRQKGRHKPATVNASMDYTDMLPIIWDEKSPTSKGYVTQCIPKTMKKKGFSRKRAGAYCASIKDKATGTTSWRNEEAEHLVQAALEGYLHQAIQELRRTGRKTPNANSGWKGGVRAMQKHIPGRMVRRVNAVRRIKRRKGAGTMGSAQSIQTAKVVGSAS